MKNKSDFNAMNVAELKKYLQERGVSVSGYLKTSLVEIATTVKRMVLPVDPNFEKDRTNDADKLIIHDMLIPNTFSLKIVNNFNSSPPFGLYDIFTTPLITTSRDSPLTSHLKIITYSMMVMWNL
ncbi:hypothetical protein OS493_001868 [Desmophyllum pertusum]|uniref:SAP domain-containing protein n=1 Tax=Desmophyllum pertusum TaxID=174260 RepID=A0A9W9Z565_9CNID|nr:hypothetical protein OS493_001868 [Desmophyllum pertusum]